MSPKVTKAFDYIKADIDRTLLIMLAFSLPFERIPSVDIYGATIRLSVIFGIVIIARTFYLVITKRIKFRVNLRSKLLLIFLTWIFLLIPQSINIGRGVSVFLFSSFTIAMAISISLLFKKQYIRPVIYAVLSSAVLVCVFAIFQYFGNILGLPSVITGIRDMYSWEVFGFPRIHSTALEPLYFASYLLLPFCTAFCLALDSKQKIIPRKLAVLLLLLFSFIIFMTVSRGALYAMAGALLIGSTLFAKLKLTSLRQILSSWAAILIGISLGLLMMGFISKIPTDAASTIKSGQKGTSAYFEHAKNTSLDDNDGRALSRQRATDIINNDRWVLVFGLGPGQFGPTVQNNIPKNGKWTIVNNLTLELMVETGIVGLLLVLVFMADLLVAGLKQFLNTKNKEEMVFLGSLCLYLVSQAIQYQSYSTLYVIYVWVPIGFLMALTYDISRSKLK